LAAARDGAGHADSTGNADDELSSLIARCEIARFRPLDVLERLPASAWPRRSVKVTSRVLRTLRAIVLRQSCKCFNARRRAMVKFAMPAAIRARTMLRRRWVKVGILAILAT
jgi:hypothetical protein